MLEVQQTRLYRNDKDIKEIDLAKANKFDNKITDDSQVNDRSKTFEDFFKHSGLSNLLKSIESELKNTFPLKAIFLENSTITTAINDGTLSSFIAFAFF